ncbi:copper resistance protein B [Pseudoxanthomonas indica]|uniref:Copper resistance protein B n=1 Tax=Pseudoxanthomonas indica TaxID=428993 RepID=A0A1T5IM76_9GAMM|nr:copper resistance protein B [Pseudoxanthomonas indica]SKC40162.1 copper resistance protein B [Pseudoxanthomonas indica]
MSTHFSLRRIIPMAIALTSLCAASAWAAQDPHAGHGGATPTSPAQDPHSHHAAPVEHTQHVDHKDHAQATEQEKKPSAADPLPPISAADRAAAFPEVSHHAMEHAPSINSFVLIDRLEGWRRDGQEGQAWEAQAWVGSDLNRLWLRTEGERTAGHTEAAQMELLYGRSVSPWWDVVAGIRHDTRPEQARSWAALGVQGLAPYKFEMAATAYLAEDGQVAATVEAEYELLLTNRLILQPRVEARLNACERVEFGEGSGLTSVEAGLRLRYEVTRRFAPYVGISHGRRFGDSARWAEAAGEHARDTHFLVGLRLWF